jgi:DNA-binding transcriptional MerR regulator
MDRDSALPPIPAKRYFTIGEVSELCLVKPYVLRYWEQEFVQLKPMKRRGNRRYYQHHEVLLIRRIRELLYEQGFTISGARNKLAESPAGPVRAADGNGVAEDDDALAVALDGGAADAGGAMGVAMLARVTGKSVATGGESRSTGRALQAGAPVSVDAVWLSPELPDFSRLSPQAIGSLREALLSIRDLLS